MPKQIQKELNGVSYNKFIFRDFLEGLFSQIIPRHHRGKIVIFLDNSSVHRHVDGRILPEIRDQDDLPQSLLPRSNPISLVLFSDHSHIGKFTLGLNLGQELITK